MKRKCISHAVVAGFLAIGLLATVVQPSYAAPKPQHRVAVTRSGSFVDAAVTWIGSFLLEKLYTGGGVISSPTPPPPPLPSGGIGNGPFGGVCIDPWGNTSPCGGV